MPRNTRISAFIYADLASNLFIELCSCSVFDILIISIVRYTPSRRALRRSPIVELVALVRIHVIAFAADFGGDELIGKQLLNATPTRRVEKQRTTATQTCVRAWIGRWNNYKDR
jgi:hypothetical protein